MARKVLTAQSIASIGSLSFGFGSDGQINEVKVVCEVSYGTVGLGETVDIWPKLTATQKQTAQTLYDRIKALVEAEYLG